MEALIVAGVAVLVLVVLLVGLIAVPRRRKAPRSPALERQARDMLDDRAPTTQPPLETTDEAVAPPQSVDVLEPEDTATPTPLVEEPPAPPAETPGATIVAEPPLSPRERFRLRLTRARQSLGAGISGAFRRGLDEEAWEELEEALISADVGVEATLEIVAGLRDRAKAEGIRTGEEALALLKEVLGLELAFANRELHRRPEGTSVWLVTGVNGTGKTTSIGKVAAKHVREGETVVLGAADTFRAAAAEQLEHWGERAGARVVRHGPGADPAAVAFDSWKAATAAGAELLVIDTAGRLQNKTELMAELSKVKRVLDREAGHVDEVLLVIDATTGQNGLQQAKAFTEAVNVTGVVLTKLDGTAKGGIVLAIQRQLGIPVKLVGLGEGVDDLAEFDPDAFVDALFAEGGQEAVGPQDEPGAVD
jgi:fused signal recognition particle receptor